MIAAASRMPANRNCLRIAGTLACFPVEIDEWTEEVRLPAYDGDHQGKSERAGTSE